MAIKLAQSDEMVRSGWWNWSVWVDGTPEELDQVTDVTYLLHPSFPDPVWVVKDRSTAFRISTAGWGSFTIHAEARLRDGSVRKLTHALTLHTPAKPAPPSDMPQVFLSYSAIDGRLAAQVSRELESHGMKVINSGSAVSLGTPDAAIRNALEDSHAVVALQSDTPSNAVQAELAKAHDLNKTVVHVQVGAPASDFAPRGNVLQFDAGAQAVTIAKKLMQMLEPTGEMPSEPTGEMPSEPTGKVKNYASRSPVPTGKAADAKPTSSREVASKSAASRKSAGSKSGPSRKAAAKSASSRNAAPKRSTNTPQPRRGR